MKQITVHKVGGAHPISWRSYKGKTEVPQWFWPGVPQEIVISQPELPLSHNLTRTDGFAPKVALSHGCQDGSGSWQESSVFSPCRPLHEAASLSSWPDSDFPQVSD